MKNLAVLLLLVASLIAVAQQPAAEPSESVSPAKAAKIRELLRITGTAELAVDAMRRQINLSKKLIPIPPKAQDDFAEQFMTAANMEEFTKLVVPVYARHFSEADLDGMIAFYRTPVGQKTVKELPMVFAEAQEAGEQWGKEIGTRVGTRIMERVKAGEYGPWPRGQEPGAQDSEHEFKPAAPAPK